MVRKVIAAVSVCLIGTPVFAQELPPSVRACTSETDSLKRLMCFDNAVSQFKTPNSQSSENVASTPSSANSVTSATPSVASTPPVSDGATLDDFGMSGKLARRRQQEQPGEEKGLQQIESTITKVSQKPYGELVIELENGQVWEQPEKKFGLVIKEGETIRISRGAMGSYFLVADSGSSTRVRRVR